MTDMTDTRTLQQVNAQEQLHRLVTWDSINEFVVRTFEDTDTRLHVLRALENSPMDTDHIDWRGIVDYAILKWLK